ncbi:MAG: GAF domain-containing sensor histidine kinase [Solirubrobacterales bacterium]|nr:GAF domain-containing sensor histidine kinase [Solirubrobacterales bacterium]
MRFREGSLVQSTLDAACGVMADLDTESVLQHVVTAAREVTGARYAALGLLDESGTRLERFITLGIDEPTRREIGPLPTGHGVLGVLIEHPVPLRLAAVGAHPKSYGFPLGHPPMASFLGVPVLAAGRPIGNLYLTEKAGEREFTADDENAVTLLAQFAGTAIDHARRFTTLELHREELQRTVEALEATVQIARAVGGQTDLDAVLSLVAKRARALVSARALAIEHEHDGALIVTAAAGDIPPEPNRARFERHGLGRLGLHAKAGIVVPLVFRSEAYGALLAIDRLEDGPRFTDHDQRLLEAFAVSAAVAVATAESAATERRSQRLAAAEQERGRWARELHDETLQGLAAVRLGLAVALRPGSVAHPIDEAVREAVGQLDEQIAGLRSLITDLRPASLDELGPGPAMEALAARVRSAGLDVDLTIDLDEQRGADRHDPEVETAMYRIIQEALTNARKHAHATRAIVQVQERDGAVRLTVRDDGDGFDPAARTAGFGLLGMRERTELLNGTLDVRSVAGHGTTVIARLPAPLPVREPAPPASASVEEASG